MTLDDLLPVRSIVEPAIPDLRAGEAVAAIPDAILGAAAPYSGPGVRSGTVIACFETHDMYVAHVGSRGVIDVLWLDGLAEPVFRSAVATFDFPDSTCAICGFGLGDVEIHAAGGHHERVAQARHGASHQSSSASPAGD
jgi:hypothetical protein